LESYYILKKKSYQVDDGWTNDSLFPPTTTFALECDRILSNLLYKKYKLLVFNITYAKVLYGKWYFLKFLTIKKIIFFMFRYFTGVNKFVLFMVAVIYKTIIGHTYVDIVYKMFVHPIDNRKLIKINGVWLANGPKDRLSSILSTSLEALGHKPNIKQEFKKDLLKIRRGLCDLDSEAKSYSATFVKNEFTKKPHKVFLEISKDYSVGYETDYKKSIENDNFLKAPIIKKYGGDKKTSVLLQDSIKSFKQRDDIKPVSFLNQISGAWENGYDENILSKKHTNSIIELDKIMLDIKNFNIKYSTKTTEDTMFKIIQGINDNDIQDI